jgi:hypothetical protein
MKNRAKCKLCQSIIESFHEFDYVSCKCGQISITGGNIRLQTFAHDYKNFLRVDDENNEIVVSVEGDDKIKAIPVMGDGPGNTPISSIPGFENYGKPTKDDLLKELDAMIQTIESLPPNAMSTPINHYDFCSLLILLSAILKS